MDNIVLDNTLKTTLHDETFTLDHLSDISDDSKTYIRDIIGDLIKDIELIPTDDFLRMIKDQSYKINIIDDMIFDITDDIESFDTTDDKCYILYCIRTYYTIALDKKLSTINKSKLKSKSELLTIPFKKSKCIKTKIIS